MDVTFDPVAFFAETAAAHLTAGPHEDPWAAASAVFNRAYPYGMPMEEYALKTLKQARQARGPEREEKLGSLAQYEIVDRVISREIGDANTSEREVLERARRVHRAKGPGGRARKIGGPRKAPSSWPGATASRSPSATSDGARTSSSSGGCTRTA